MRLLTSSPNLILGSLVPYTRPQQERAVWSVTFFRFFDPAGMLDLHPLSSLEMVGFLDGKKSLYGRTGSVRIEAG